MDSIEILSAAMIDRCGMVGRSSTQQRDCTIRFVFMIESSYSFVAMFTRAF